MITYLYGYGKTRHIASKTPGASLCGHWFDSEAEMRRKLAYLGLKAEEKIRKRLQLPVCQLCEKTSARAKPSAS